VSAERECTLACVCARACVCVHARVCVRVYNIVCYMCVPMWCSCCNVCVRVCACVYVCACVVAATCVRACVCICGVAAILVGLERGMLCVISSLEKSGLGSTEVLHIGCSMERVLARAALVISRGIPPSQEAEGIKRNVIRVHTPHLNRNPTAHVLPPCSTTAPMDATQRKSTQRNAKQRNAKQPNATQRNATQCRTATSSTGPLLLHHRRAATSFVTAADSHRPSCRHLFSGFSHAVSTG
jgi:hypothetical protein